VENYADVLNSAESLSSGGIWEKIRASDILINSFWKLPRHECDEILIKLAQNNQPTEVRLHIALNLLRGPHIDNNTYQNLVHTLINRL
jgi:hypothetical protein